VEDRDWRAIAVSRLRIELAEFAARLDALKEPNKAATAKTAAPTAPVVEFAKQIVIAMRSRLLD